MRDVAGIKDLSIAHLDIEVVTAVWAEAMHAAVPPSIAIIPNASHTQMPHQSRPRARTRYGEGRADRGFAIQMYGVPGANTSTRASARRRNEASTSSVGISRSRPSSGGIGGRP